MVAYPPLLPFLSGTSSQSDYPKVVHEPKIVVQRAKKRFSRHPPIISAL